MLPLFRCIPSIRRKCYSCRGAVRFLREFRQTLHTFCRRVTLLGAPFAYGGPALSFMKRGAGPRQGGAEGTFFFLKGMKSNGKKFYAALDSLKRKRPEEVERLFLELLKIALSDGRLHYNEKWLLAEIWEQLRCDGLIIKDII